MRIVLDLQGAQSESRFRGIGRYSLALAQAIAREACQHEVWLALNGRFPGSIEPLRAAFLDLIPNERIRVFELPGPIAEMDPANAWRMQAAELIREKFLADLNPDIVHLSTLFEGIGDDVATSVGRLSSLIPTAATLYDLIPMFYSDIYLSDPMIKRSYLRRIQSLKRADLLLAISESSRREAIQALQISEERITTINAGLSDLFQNGETPGNGQQSTLAERYGLRGRFVMYTGGEDHRKNLEGMIAAFALLPRKIRAVHQLAIVCKLSETARRRLTAAADQHGLRHDEVLLPGYVPDEDLRLLYASCSVFVFPSFHEGFGLPVLEAMACGAPVIGSNCTSIPEIINRNDALFDPHQPREMAARMAEVLSNAELRRSLKAWGHERAKAFTWEVSARKALRAFEALHAERKAGDAVMARPVLRRRPLLAFVAPLPPQRSGIAGYSARLLPSLARHYEIVCIADQPEVSDPWITAEFAIRDVRWFKQNARRFERILYQFGNSELHRHMFGLLEEHPGVVALHDFYLSGGLSWMEAFRYAPGSFTKALWDSHGFSAFEYDRVNGRRASVAAYPCNAAVLGGSIGLIVHSSQAIELARTRYGDRASAHMRQVPFLPSVPERTERRTARNRLGNSENAFVVCSFGFLGPTKLSNRLLEAWLASPLAGDEACFLIFVGENESGDYGEQLWQRIADSPAGARMRITGYADESEYRDYLAAADLAVQLRTGSRGETSATIFDCLAHCVPLIINAHGSAAELPDDVVTKLDDSFTDQALSAALASLRANVNLRRKLAARGTSYLNEVHHPERVAELYREIIEEAYTNSSQAQEQRLVQAIARISAPVGPTDADLAGVATALAANRERFGLPQILVDVTNVAKFDLRAGIERVTHGILMALIADPPSGYRIEPVRAAGEGYVYARRFACQCLALSEVGLTDDPVETGHDDIFLGLDLSIDFVPSLKPWFLTQRRRGTRIVFVVYDLLPLLRPDLFPANLPPVMLDWVNTIAQVGDGMVCISRAVADELCGWLSEAKPERLQPLSLGFFHLGADLRASLPTTGLSEDAAEVLEKIRSRPSFLMVGTLEPSKGYRQALAGMERLWTAGIDANLVIVGKKGWETDGLVKQIEHYSENGNRLFWLQAISDEILEELYRSCQALLAASEGEGFGSPLIEAAQYGLPIIARDIAVFHEIAGDHAYYFRGNEAEDLADALRTWLSLRDAVPSSVDLPWLTWQQSSRQLLDVVMGERWYRTWPATKIKLSLPHGRPCYFSINGEVDRDAYQQAIAS